MGYKISALTAAGSAPQTTDLFEISRANAPYDSKSITWANIQSAFTTGFSTSGAAITNDVLTGKSGGQTFIGGTASGNNMTLSSTSHATKGKIIFGTSAYDEANNRLGLGTTSPTAVLHLKAGTATAGTAPLKFTSGTNLATPEAGVMEFNGSELYWTQSTTRMVLFSNRGNSNNLIVGKDVANTSFTGDSNIIFGTTFGGSLTSGYDNVLIGRGTSTTLSSGSGNVAIGCGINNQNVTGTVLIGQYAGLATTSTSYSVMIGNSVNYAGTSATGPVLMLGSFSTISAAGVTNSTGIGHRHVITAANQCVIGSSAGAEMFTEIILFGSEGAVDRATQHTMTLRLPSMYSNTGVANRSAHTFAIKGALSTGNGTGGDIQFYTTNNGASGTTLNAYAQRLQINGITGELQFSDATNIIFNATTGTKIGTAASQKFAFWNATPIVQPTTAIAAATFVANASGIVDDSATFDGYTIGQIAKALRNSGLLA